MSETTDKFPRVTQAQVDIWMLDPVTISLVSSLVFDAAELTKEIISAINPENNDATVNAMSAIKSRVETLNALSDLPKWLEHCEMIEESDNAKAS